MSVTVASPTDRTELRRGPWAAPQASSNNGHAANGAAGVPASMATRLSDGIDRFGVDWRGRSVGVVGMARSGMAAYELLRQVGARISISDRNQDAATQQVAERLRQSGVEHIELGHHSRGIFDDCDVLVVSPGVPESAAPIRWAIENGTPIISEVELAFRFCNAPIIAVTGTNGKSSVVTLIDKMLRARGKPSVACGNLGIPFCSVIPSLTPDTTVVLEISSFQLVWCDQFRPNVGVLLNLGSNHLDRHPDHESYVMAKARLFDRQSPHDFAVLNSRDPAVSKLGERMRAQRGWFGAPEGAEAGPQAARFVIDAATHRALPENMQAVLQVARILDIPDPFSYQTIREFRGLEHRIEYVETIRGVRVINDSKSTTPESCLYALTRCGGHIVLILGGKDKGMDFRILQPVLQQERIRGIVLVGDARPALRGLFQGSLKVREAETFDGAVRAAVAAAHAGDTVLFSPACASFDMFRNFEERGRVFKQLVRQLAREAAGASSTIRSTEAVAGA